MVQPSYFWPLFQTAVADTWELVVGGKLATFAVAAVVFVVTLVVKRRTLGEDAVRTVLSDALLTAGVMCVLGVILFLVHFLVVSPRRMYVNAESARLALESTVRESSPDISLAINQAVFSTAKGKLTSGVEVDAPYVMLVVSVINKRSPSSVIGFSMTFTLKDGTEAVGQLMELSDGMTLPGGTVIHKSDALFLKTADPIPTGGYIQGRLAFLFQKHTLEQISTSTAGTLTSKDVWGNSPQAVIDMTKIKVTRGPSTISFPLISRQ